MKCKLDLIFSSWCQGRSSVLPDPREEGSLVDRAAQKLPLNASSPHAWALPQDEGKGLTVMFEV